MPNRDHLTYTPSPPNALPRDIRVRGSKPANPHYHNQSMEHRSSTTHTQSSNTERHYTHPKYNEDTNTQQTPSTKNYSSPNFYRKGTDINKSCALLHTNDSKIYTKNTEEINKTDQTLGNHKIFQLIYIPEEPATKITQKQPTKHKQIIPQREALIPPVFGGLSAPQSLRGSRHVTFNPDQSQTTGGTPTAHSANVITVSAAMLSTYPDRFTASASALKEHYPTVQKHLVDFSTRSASCTQ